MTNAHSKLFTTVDCTCADYHHPWTDSCWNSSAGLLLSSFPYCVRIYSFVNLLSLIMRHRIPELQDLKKTIYSILQSSAFLCTNSYGFTMYNCLVRHLLGRYYFLTAVFVPAFLASWTALLLERPARRPLLALYVANNATEAVWNMAVTRGYIRNVPHGQTLIFGISISILLYLYRLGLHKTNCKDSLYDILRIFVGKAEEGPTVEVSSPPTESAQAHVRPPLSFTSITGFLQIYERFIEKVKSKHASCRHENACVNYALLGGLKPLVGGISLQVALKLLMNVKKIVQMKMEWRKTVFNRNTLKLGIFLGSFSFLYKSVSCILRHGFGHDDARFAIPAGLIGSIAFTQYPDNTVAIYVLWKMLQIVYNLGIEKGVVPEVPHFIILLYSCCTGILFHAGVLEPKTLRPSYFKFLQSVSGQRLNKFNTLPFDVYGLNSAACTKEVCASLNIIDKSPLPDCAFAS